MVAVFGLGFGILVSAIFIDIITLVIVSPYLGFKWLFIQPKKVHPKILKKYSDVAVIIPAYNEEKYIKKSIESAFNQTIPPKKVIVVNDCSTDSTGEVCDFLKKKYRNLIVIHNEINAGKAANTRNALYRYVNEEITIILDSDTFLSKNYIEEVIKPFVNRRVAITTGSSMPIMQKRFFSKIIYHGATFQYKFFSFRKRAQAFRNAVSVITGDSAAYRTSFLKEVGGLPDGTQTEDMDITWASLEKGYRVAYMGKAKALCENAGTLVGHWKQLTRWYCGGFQCVVKHRKTIWGAKPLLFTTLIPAHIDSLLYSIAFLIAPFFLFVNPLITLGFYTADLFFTIIAILIVQKRSLLHLPEVYIIKFIWSVAWLYAAGKTSLEFLRGKRKWTGRWARDGFYDDRAPKRQITIEREKPIQQYKLKKLESYL
jgi:cellulose synthase/poly-beta-1,6-N-acetylglucosamine synthase-like glycosyltransferase